MNKGFAVKTMVELLIAAIILFLLVPPLFGTVKEVYAQILQGLGVIKLSSIEKATLCSLYRCTEGCASIKMEEIKWEDKELKKEELVSCNDFCNNLPCDKNNLEECYTDTDKLTVCGAQAMKYPVTFSAKTDLTINQKHISNDVTCIITSDSYTTGTVVVFHDGKFVFIDNSVLNKKKITNDCPNVANAIETATIKTPLYMYTYQVGCPVPGCSGGWNNLITELTATTPHITLPCDQECKIQGFSYGNCRRNVCLSGQTDIGVSGCGIDFMCCCS